MRIGITARFEQSSHGETWYAFDHRLLASLNDAFPMSELCLLNPISNLTLPNLDLLIFSGGSTPGEVPQRDQVEKGYFLRAKELRIPAIGICRGAQLFAVIAGAELSTVNGHLNTSRSSRDSQILGNCFHNWGIFDLPDDWRVLTRDDGDNSIELFKHLTLPIVGVMAHPERHPKSREFLNELLRIAQS